MKTIAYKEKRETVPMVIAIISSMVICPLFALIGLELSIVLVIIGMAYFGFGRKTKLSQITGVSCKIDKPIGRERDGLEERRRLIREAKEAEENAPSERNTEEVGH